MMPRCGGLLYDGDVCNRCVAPAAFISFESATAFAVSLEPAPAAMGTRPFVCSTVISTTRRCSAAVIVTASPVEPHGTRKWIPCSICQSTSCRSAPSSSAPSLVNGVTSAVPHPFSFSAMAVPQHIRHRENTVLADQPLRCEQRAIGEHLPVARHVLESNLFEPTVEDQLVRPGNRSCPHARDRNVAPQLRGARLCQVRGGTGGSILF